MGGMMIDKTCIERIGMMPGDWICPSCFEVCFASKDSCFMCGTPKPAGLESADGGCDGGCGGCDGMGCGMGNMGCGMNNMGCGMNNMGCGMNNMGNGNRTTPY